MGGDCGLQINQDVCSLCLLTLDLKQVHPVEEHYYNSVSWYFRKYNLPHSAASLENLLGLFLNSSSCLFLLLSGLSYTKVYLYIDFPKPCTVVGKRVSTILQDYLKEKQQKHATKTISKVCSTLFLPPKERLFRNSFLHIHGFIFHYCFY